MNTPRERLARLRAELDALLVRRDRLDDAGLSTDALDNQIAARRATLLKLTDVAEFLERMTRRKSA